MNWLAVIGAGLGGAIGGALGAGLGAVFVKDPAHKKWRGVFAIVPIILLGQMGASLGKSQAVRNLLSPPTRLEKLVHKYGDPLFESSLFKERLAALPADQAAHPAQLWTHAGLKRLDADDLDAWNAIRLKVAKASKPLCAGLWTGKLDIGLFVSELQKLPDPDLDAWARLSVNAMRRELESKGVPSSDPKALGRAISAIRARLPAAAATRFDSDLKQGIAVSDDEACWAFVTLAGGAVTLESSEREGLLRTLAAL